MGHGLGYSKPRQLFLVDLGKTNLTIIVAKAVRRMKIYIIWGLVEAWLEVSHHA
jgi:hypothetical protein